MKTTQIALLALALCACTETTLAEQWRGEHLASWTCIGGDPSCLHHGCVREVRLPDVAADDVSNEGGRLTGELVLDESTVSLTLGRYLDGYVVGARPMAPIEIRDESGTLHVLDVEGALLFDEAGERMGAMGTMTIGGAAPRLVGLAITADPCDP